MDEVCWDFSWAVLLEILDPMKMFFCFFEGNPLLEESVGNMFDIF